MADVLIIVKTVVNFFSLILHSFLLLTIAYTPALKSHSFDLLFFSQNIGDMVAVALRLITRYGPIIVLRNHTGVIEVDKNTFPLATITNAAEWYTNYIIILSALVFSMDRAVMAVSFRNYAWFCNMVFKIFLVIFTWLVPFAWVLPMFDPCCRSQYYGGRIELVEMKHPEWNKLIKKRRERHLKSSSSIIVLPPLKEVQGLCRDPERQQYFPRHDTATIEEHEHHRDNRILARLDLELSFVMISIIDQQIDFCAVLFYTLYWASYSGYIPEEHGTVFFEMYSYFFEVGTILSPYVLLIFCEKLRKEFIARIRRCCKHTMTIDHGVG